mmetsp:Transcript_16058/g.17971  ORF Transcript_16058/g.17971 Transcript_16058/m.17971 type:complete len:1054 (-) Transcript_16058:969-4130(-)
MADFEDDFEELDADAIDIDQLEEFQEEAEVQKFRKPLPSDFSESERLAFMQIDIDYYHGPSVLLEEREEQSILRMYGITQEGHSVMCHIHGFRPYIFVPVPTHMTELTPANLNFFREKLNQLLSKGRPEIAVTEIQVVEKSDIMNYQGPSPERKFFQIFTRFPKFVNQIRGLCERGFQLGDRTFQTFTYESNIPFALRFMIDTKIVGMNWIELEPETYKLREPRIRISRSQIELDVHYQKLVIHKAEGEWQKIAPIRILSFDIECSAEEGGFPVPEKDKVIQIANYCKEHGSEEPLLKTIFTLKDCLPIAGARVKSFSDERELLRAWRDFLVEVDPDILTGYNIINFDFPYLINRAKHLKVPKFSYMSRILTAESRIKETTFQSKAVGLKESKEITMDGRIHMDMIQIIFKDYKLSSYSLNNVSIHFLNEQKEDVHHGIISELQNGTPETRRRLAVYCLKDAYLPLRLLEKLMSLFNYTEMARVTGVPISYLFTRGQQIKVCSQLLRKCLEHDIVIPTNRTQGSQGTYEGATVIDPIKGFYKEPIATLDFASLYPSIMMAHNLCYTTLLTKEDISKMDPKDYTRTPRGDCFVKHHLKKGLLPVILEELLGARKKAKKELKEATDPFVKGVLDGRQLALKISANSVYGFTGAQVGQLPCLAISSSVTAFGREMIDATKLAVETKYRRANGYPTDAQVVYGDTDSVMVKFGVDTVAEAMKLGEEAARIISEQFLSPIKLEFEKVYFPYLLMNKKRYAGLYWTNPEKYDKLDSKGLETVRRDNCALVRRVCSAVLDMLLIDQNVDGAIDFVKGTISDLLQNKVDLSLLVITKALMKKQNIDGKSSGNNSYQVRQAHTELAERMRKRDPASAPKSGDRIPFVIIRGSKNAKNYERSEDPIYVLDNDLPIDFNYYLDHQLKQPLTRLFEPILSNVDELFAGEHTRTLSAAKVSKTSGIGMFTVKKVTCLGCKSGIKDGALCPSCKDRSQRIYVERVLELKKHQGSFNELWTQCQRCQGSLHQDVLCTSRDCPIFYRRKKVQKDLEDSFKTVERFNNEW